MQPYVAAGEMQVPDWEIKQRLEAIITELVGRRTANAPDSTSRRRKKPTLRLRRIRGQCWRSGYIFHVQNKFDPHRHISFVFHFKTRLSD